MSKHLSFTSKLCLGLALFLVTAALVQAGTNYITFDSPNQKFILDNNVQINGNVGIGMPAPQDKLHINNGNIRLTGTGRVVQAVGGNLILNADSTNDIQFAQNGTIVAGIYDGNVGIGTATPGEKLDVNGSIKLMTTGTATANTQYPSYQILFDSSSWSTNYNGPVNRQWKIKSIGQNNYWGQPRLSFLSDYDNVERMVIDMSTGNVGIGTAGPNTQLNIYNASSGPIINLQGATTNYRGLKIADTGNTEKWFAGADNSNNYVIRRNGATNDLTINSSGNVTFAGRIDTPGIKFTNNYSSGWSGWNYVIQIENNSHGMIYNSVGGIGFGLHSNGNFYWANTTSGNYPMYLTKEGSLTVAGLLSAGSISTSGSLSAGSISTSGSLSAGSISTSGSISADSVSISRSLSADYVSTRNASISENLFAKLQTYTVRIECNGECNGYASPTAICQKFKPNSVGISVACRTYNGGTISSAGTSLTGCTQGTSGDSDDDCAGDYTNNVGFLYYCDDTNGWDAIVTCAYL